MKVEDGIRVPSESSCSDTASGSVDSEYGESVRAWESLVKGKERFLICFSREARVLFISEYSLAMAPIVASSVIGRVLRSGSPVG